MTLGVSSRYIGTDTGAERVRVGVAQRFYFDTQDTVFTSQSLGGSFSGDGWFADLSYTRGRNVDQVTANSLRGSMRQMQRVRPSREVCRRSGACPAVGSTRRRCVPGRGPKA